MTRRNGELAAALRATAAHLRAGARYEWGHMGRCNCGHLVQTLTGLTDREILARVGYQLDEWTEHAHGRCGTTGVAADDIFQSLAQVGVTRADVAHLEHLSDTRVLAVLENRSLRRNSPVDVADYMEAMATMVESAGGRPPAVTEDASPVRTLAGSRPHEGIAQTRSERPRPARRPVRPNVGAPRRNRTIAVRVRAPDTSDA